MRMRLSQKAMALLVSLFSASRMRTTTGFARVSHLSAVFIQRPQHVASASFVAVVVPRGGDRRQCRHSSTASTEDTNVVTATSADASNGNVDQDEDFYQKLVAKLETVTQLGRASAVLSYDQLVFMPSNAAAERGAQMAALASVIHEKQTDPQLLKLLEEAGASAVVANDKDARRLIELERKAFLENQRVPTNLAAKAASLSASAYRDWVDAKEKSDFAAFVPTLQDCFDTAMALADAKRGEDRKNDVDLYDQMLDEFEVGMPQSRIDEMFAEVQEALVPLIASVLGPTATPPSSDLLEGTFDVPKQQKLSEQLVTAIGFDRDNGRIDVSVHPFSSSMSAADVRITSRFRADEWYQGLAGTLHEGGHAIYEQNLNKPSALSIDSALSMGTHESQSLFWERHIGLSKPFWRFATPYLKETFPEKFVDCTEEQIYAAVNGVSLSLIRVEADELTYPLHVVLRYNIEKDVIAGKLAVADIPQRWNDDMKMLLNVDVPSDAKGALQDVHWSGLAFGYFPTYLIGAIAAAQLYHFCHQDIPDLEDKIESGNFAPIKEWLTTKVHQHGRRYSSLDTMMEDQLGEPLNPKYFIDYLTRKYKDLYQLEK